MGGSLIGVGRWRSEDFHARPFGRSEHDVLHMPPPSAGGVGSLSRWARLAAPGDFATGASRKAARRSLSSISISEAAMRLRGSRVLASSRQCSIRTSRISALAVIRLNKMYGNTQITTKKLPSSEYILLP